MSGDDPGLVDALGDVLGVVDDDVGEAVDTCDSCNRNFGKLESVSWYLKLKSFLVLQNRLQYFLTNVLGGDFSMLSILVDLVMSFIWTSF